MPAGLVGYGPLIGQSRRRDGQYPPTKIPICPDNLNAEWYRGAGCEQRDRPANCVVIDDPRLSLPVFQSTDQNLSRR